MYFSGACYGCTFERMETGRIRWASRAVRALWLLMLGFAAPVLHAQTILVHPGDANNDGKADVYDVLHIGWAFGEAGPVRTGTLDWFAFPVSFWGDSIMSTVDRAYADADGSGIVESADLDVVQTNTDSVHGLATYVQTFSPLVPSGIPVRFGGPTIVPLGSDRFEVQVRILLGSVDIGADSVYNAAFRLLFDTANLADEPDVVTWTRNDALFPIGLHRLRPEEGAIEIGLSRTNQTLVGTGVVDLGTLGLIMEGNLAGGILADTLLNLHVVSPAVFGLNDLALLDIWSPEDSLALLPVGFGTAPLSERWKVGPNPARHRIQVTLTGLAKPLQLTLVDAVGRQRRVWHPSIGANTLLLDGLAPGCYTLHLQNADGRQDSKRILVLP